MVGADGEDAEGYPVIGCILVGRGGRSWGGGRGVGGDLCGGGRGGGAVGVVVEGIVSCADPAAGVGPISGCPPVSCGVEVGVDAVVLPEVFAEPVAHLGVVLFDGFVDFAGVDGGADSWG